ncbi:polyamine transporter 1 [Trichomonascus vanleenenianus]|uniref:MFS transporter n=1 Tax=Trichomonascus vanleenenianus TaxID=2268995 RepID=UPI003ECAF2A6
MSNHSDLSEVKDASSEEAPRPYNTGITAVDTVPYEDDEITNPLAQIFTGRSSVRTRSRVRTEFLTLGAGKPIPPHIGHSTAYSVDFDGPDDPTNPLNWPIKRKIKGAAPLALTTMVIAWGSAAYAPAVPGIMEEFGVSRIVALLGLSLYILGFAAGPVLWGSTSEYFGRKGPTLLSNFGLAVFTFGSAAAKDFQTLVLCRFFAGLIGSAPFAVVGGAFTDMFPNKLRGTALAVYLSAVFTGPILAPVVSGFIAESYLGWRWTMYLTGILASATLVLDIFLYEESYHPIILVDKARKLREETGNWAIHALAERNEVDINQIAVTTITRPFRMLVTQPIVFFISIYIAFVYGILYLCLEAFPIIFAENYGMKGGVAELPYIGVLIGIFCVNAYIISMEPRYGRIVAKKTNGKAPVPEARLDVMILPAFCFPIGLFWLCWSGAYPEKVHWIVPTIGGAIIGFGLMGVFLNSILYLVESYLMLSASAMAASAFTRAVFAASFPLFGFQLFNNLGVQWGGTLLGCVAAAMVPIPFILKAYASKLKSTIKIPSSL